MSRCIRSFILFFFNDTATTEIYTLSLHDALPISCLPKRPCDFASDVWGLGSVTVMPASSHARRPASRSRCQRSEEHTSELQSHLNLVCRLLLEKKKNNSTQ